MAGQMVNGQWLYTVMVRAQLTVLTSNAATRAGFMIMIMTR